MRLLVAAAAGQVSAGWVTTVASKALDPKPAWRPLGFSVRDMAAIPPVLGTAPTPTV